MRKCILILCILPFTLWANDNKLKSTITHVTVYLSGAQITRTSNCTLEKGMNEMVFTGLSHKIDESSIQVSGLYGASILSIDYDINYIEKSESHPKLAEWELKIEDLNYRITLLKNIIFGLEEEQKVITTNRMVSTDNQALDLEKVKEISQYYRERLTEIKNEIFQNNSKINDLNKEMKAIKLQMKEANSAPAQEQGEITIKFDAPKSTTLTLTLKYMVKDAGWVPNYDIKSKDINAPIQMAYKANVYQNTGKDWNNVHVVLSTGNPDHNISKPNLQAHYLNFTSGYSRRYSPVQKKKGYAFNPAVKKVAGTVSDGSGLPLPGVNIIVKGTTHGTQTDFDGNYELEVPFGQELSFSYVGMHSQDIPLYSSIINLKMEEDTQALDEVVVTGMAIKREKRALGYAVTSVSAEQIVQGKTEGVNIRGNSSISRSNHPMKLHNRYISLMES